MYLLVTGASGHIGGAVSYNCNQRKIKSILLTRSNYKKKILKKKFKYCVVKKINELKKKVKITDIIHTASINDIKSNSKINSINISLNITKKIFSKLNLKNVKKVIYLSTAQVYGHNLINTVSEKTKTKPANKYGLSRLANEQYLFKLSKKYNFKLLVLRISNVVGETELFDKNILRLLPNDIKNQAKNDNIVSLRSSGLQYRNFISLNSTAKIIIKLLSEKTKNFDIFNLGGVNTKVIFFVKKFILYYNKKFKTKVKLNILSLEPKISKKLNFSSNKLFKKLKIKKKETVDFIIQNFI